MDDENTKLFTDSKFGSLPKPADKPLYEQKGQGSTSRYMQYAFVTIVVIMVVITLILSIYQGVEHNKLGSGGGLYFMLGLSLVGFVSIQILMMWFIKKEHLPADKMWFLYFVGVCIVIEAIFTNVLLFQYTK